METAALKKQSLRDAPADVSVVTAAEIRRYGYRTLGEALSNVRGFYTTFDGGFEYVGVRGFSLLGDYNTRFLVMINGHQMTDNVYGAMYLFGQEFGLDMDLVEQIEIVRGPSSSLYGSNGVFATINIITRKAVDPSPGRISTETGSFGETKALASTTFKFGRNGRGFLAGSLFHTGGRTLALNTPDSEEALVLSGVGKEQGYHSFASIVWDRWSLIAMFGERRISVPTGYFASDLGDSGTRSLDARNFVELSWHRPLGRNKELKWRAFYDQYRYDAIYTYRESLNAQNFDGAAGDWIGTQLLYQQENTRIGSITMGAKATVDIRNLQYNYDLVSTPIGPEREDRFTIRHPNTNYAVFMQDEWKPARAWTAYLGARIDASATSSAVFSPRATVVYQRSSTAYKMTYGKAFRNPSAYERYYVPNPSLTAERLQSIEFSREQQLGQRLKLLTSVFRYSLGGLIQGVAIADRVTLQYQNNSQVSATGVEVELSGHPFQWLDTTMSYTIHRVRGIDGQHRLENSPSRIGQFRAAVPFARDRIMLGGAVRYVSSRSTAFAGVVPAATVLDLTVNGKIPGSVLDLQFGVRNFLDQQYADPLSPEHSSAVLPRAGRSAYLKFTWQGGKL